jgi:hypothetical protein
VKFSTHTPKIYLFFYPIKYRRVLVSAFVTFATTAAQMAAPAQEIMDTPTYPTQLKE